MSGRRSGVAGRQQPDAELGLRSSPPVVWHQLPDQPSPAGGNPSHGRVAASLMSPRGAWAISRRLRRNGKPPRVRHRRSHPAAERRAGDAVVLFSLTPHATGRTTTDETRRACIVQYAPERQLLVASPGSGRP